MRWSTPSFGIGLALGLLAALVLWLDRGGEGVGSHAGAPDEIATADSPAAPALGSPGRTTEPGARSEADTAARTTAGDPVPGRIQRTPRHADEDDDTDVDPSAPVATDSPDGSRVDLPSPHPTPGESSSVVVSGLAGRWVFKGRSEILLADSSRFVLEVQPHRVRLAVPGLSLDPAVRIDWERAWAAAGEWGAPERNPPAELVTNLLHDEAGDQVLLGIGLAARSTPPGLEQLAELARDPDAGSFRAVALVALAHHRDAGGVTVDTVVELARDPEFHVRSTAIALFPHFGKPVAWAARQLLRDGEYGARAVDALVETAVQGDADDLLRFVANGVEPQIALAVLAKINGIGAERSSTRALMRSLAYDHPNAWVREAARLRLQDAAPADSSTLKIVSATYGEDERTIDVANVLARLVTDGRLVIRAHNGLAGDPAVGKQKVLVVTYEIHGRRHTRSATEGQTLSIP